MFILHWNEELLYNRKHSVYLALRQDVKRKNQGQLENRQTAELREVGHPARWRGLGRSEAKKLICMKRKGGRNRKKKVAQQKTGKLNKQMRAALETQVRSRHANPAARHTCGRMWTLAYQGLGPRPAPASSAGGAIVRPVNGTQKQILSLAHLSEYITNRDAASFPHRITTF